MLDHPGQRRAHVARQGSERVAVEVDDAIGQREPLTCTAQRRTGIEVAGPGEEVVDDIVGHGGNVPRTQGGGSRPASPAAYDLGFVKLTIGVLAVQGDVREHAATLTALGADVVAVRRPGEVEQIDGLVIPGGESTVMDKLVRAFDLQEPLRKRIADGLPTLGSCAGMIMLADRIADARPDQQTLGGIDMTVRRNAFGRQVDSFETDLDYAGLDEPVHAVFIRAPWVDETGEDVEVLARVGEGPAAGRIVAVRQGNLMATSFHPEVGGDRRIHAEFVRIVENARESA